MFPNNLKIKLHFKVMEAVISPQKNDGQEPTVLNADNSTESDAMISVLEDIILFTKFQKTVEKNIFDLEWAIISQQKNPNNNIYNVGADDENAKSDFILDLLKKPIIKLENEISKKIQ